MAIITLNKKKFEKEIGKLDERMENKIAMFGTPIENITSDEIQIEVFPNRPDMLSYQGFKRSFLSFLGRKMGLKEYKINKPRKNYKVLIESSVKDIRPFTACAIVKKLKLNSDMIKELIEIQEKLHLTLGRRRKKVAIGIYPLEEIKLPITFKALEPEKIKFVPLEGKREMTGFEILQRHPAGKEYSHLLAGKTKFPIFMDKDKNILSMPPIINSQKTGRITEKTKDVFVECSGADFEVLKKCLNIIVTSLADMGGAIYQMDLRFSGKKNDRTPNLKSEEMKISLQNTNTHLGLNLDEKQLKKLIEKMGNGYSKGIVQIPAWRTDVLHEVDLIEDVAIAYGYENFVPEIPSISTIGEIDLREVVKKRFSEILAGLNMLEVSNYHLTTLDAQFDKMGISKNKKWEFVEVEDSKTDYKILRKDITHYLMKVLSENIDSEYPQRIFEMGRVFDLKEKIEEKEFLSVAISPGNFTDIKQILEYFFMMVGFVVDIRETDNCPAYLVDGRTAEIVFEGKRIGFVGEVHPKILRNWRIKMPVAIFEIDLDSVFNKLVQPK